MSVMTNKNYDYIQDKDEEDDFCRSRKPEEFSPEEIFLLLITIFASAYLIYEVTSDIIKLIFSIYIF